MDDIDEDDDDDSDRSDDDLDDQSVRSRDEDGNPKPSKHTEFGLTVLYREAEEGQRHFRNGDAD